MTLPGLHFRRREGGATVFRVTEDGPSGRVELTPIAQVALKANEIRPQGGRVATAAETEAMAAWLAAERAAAGARVAGDCAAALGRAAHWAQGQATEAEVAAEADALFLAMHDLRQALLRRLSAPAEDDAGT